MAMLCLAHHHGDPGNLAELFVGVDAVGQNRLNAHGMKVRRILTTCSIQVLSPLLSERQVLLGHDHGVDQEWPFRLT
ncbi:hypothetical protein KBY66_14330 [Synechococcus sp. Tobar12-5m-g]|uniref:hypothetical protein n=1 Tax=unclassified Synechococcus TaxID=2626047 RepID=UPI0020CE3FA5|nr:MULTISPECIES: hypothetical protein [unclassified Synechococcus]MCP9773773.1 hypothetical protein [Synechococcus sp. Tobar12-5m-g]MCP9874772.1 hypothetical protein [Synechococcus sp. Cruz CV-v-12]